MDKYKLTRKNDLLDLNVGRLRFRQVLPVSLGNGRVKYFVSDKFGVHSTKNIKGRLREVYVGEQTPYERVITVGDIGRLPKVEEILSARIDEMLKDNPHLGLMNGLVFGDTNLHRIGTKAREDFQFALCKYHGIPNIPKSEAVIPAYSVPWMSEILAIG